MCVWLFALLKHNVQRECVKERLFAIHHAFIDFLSDDSGKHNMNYCTLINSDILKRKDV